jgi:hypothetical protein
VGGVKTNALSVLANERFAAGIKESLIAERLRTSNEFIHTDGRAIVEQAQTYKPAAAGLMAATIHSLLMPQPAEVQ